MPRWRAVCTRLNLSKISRTFQSNALSVYSIDKIYNNRGRDCRRFSCAPRTAKSGQKHRFLATGGRDRPTKISVLGEISMTLKITKTTMLMLRLCALLLLASGATASPNDQNDGAGSSEAAASNPRGSYDVSWTTYLNPSSRERLCSVTIGKDMYLPITRRRRSSGVLKYE